MVFCSIFFKINWLGYDYNIWGVIFSAVGFFFTAISAFFVKNEKQLSIRGKARNSSTVIQAGGNIEIANKIESQSDGK